MEWRVVNYNIDLVRLKCVLLLRYRTLKVSSHFLPVLVVHDWVPLFYLSEIPPHADSPRGHLLHARVGHDNGQEPAFPPGSSIASVMYAGESPVMRTLLECDPGKKVGRNLVPPSALRGLVSASGTASMPPAAYDTESADTCKVPASSSARTNEAIIRSFPGRTLTVTVLLNDPIQQQAA